MVRRGDYIHKVRCDCCGSTFEFFNYEKKRFGFVHAHSYFKICSEPCKKRLVSHIKAPLSELEAVPF